MKQTIIHHYYKRKFEDYTVLVQVNPKSFKGMELILHPDGEVEKTKMIFDKEIFEDLEEDQFQCSSALEFNLYLKGLVKPN